MSSSNDYTFIKRRHMKFFLRCLNVLPNSCSSFDTNRMVVLFFALSGLDVMNCIDEIPENDRLDIIEWIYSRQIIPKKGHMNIGGFVGGSSLDINDELNPRELLHGHITMTYSALASLLILEDDLSRINKDAILNLVGSLQRSDGCFYDTSGKIESDMRFVYSAIAVCHLLNDFSTINCDNTFEYIMSSKSYEGGFGQGSQLESHGGSTFCAIASLHLLNKLTDIHPDKTEELVKWLVCRQETDGGLNGRPNKPADTCYTFWIGAALKLLSSLQLVNEDLLCRFVLSAQDPITGGISKYPSGEPDGLHSYLAISGLSLFNSISERFELNDIDPAVNVTRRTLNHMKSIHKRWRD